MSSSIFRRYDVIETDFHQHGEKKLLWKCAKSTQFSKLNFFSKKKNFRFFPMFSSIFRRYDVIETDFHQHREKKVALEMRQIDSVFKTEHFSKKIFFDFFLCLPRFSDVMTS